MFDPIEERLRSLRDFADEQVANRSLGDPTEIIRRGIRGRFFVSSAALVAIGLLGFGTVRLVSQPKPLAPIAPPPPSSSPSQEEPLSLSPGQRRFIGYQAPARTEDGATRIKGSFLDATQVTFQYPEGLRLEKIGVRPTGAFEIGVSGEGCGTIFLSSYGSDAPFHAPGTPLARYTSASGDPVELWASYPDDPAEHYLVFEVGEWYLAIADSTSDCVTRDGWAEVWASNIEAKIDQSGFLNVNTGPSIKIRDLRLTWSRDELLLEAQKLTDGCSLEGSDVIVTGSLMTTRSRGFAMWCESGAPVVFRADSENKELLDSLVDGLRAETT